MYFPPMGVWLSDINYEALPDVWPPSTLYVLNWNVMISIIKNNSQNSTFPNLFQDGNRFSELYFVYILGWSVWALLLIPVKKKKSLASDWPGFSQPFSTSKIGQWSFCFSQLLNLIYFSIFYGFLTNGHQLAHFSIELLLIVFAM